MTRTSGILLSENFPNKLTVGGELAWFTEEQNASTGYRWGFTPDNSGVYELVETIELHPSVEHAVGVPGRVIWKFKATRSGHGAMLFHLIPPGSSTPAKEIKIAVTVG